MTIWQIETCMSEAIPLRAALRIQGPHIIICKIVYQRLDLMLEALARKCRGTWHVQRKAVQC